MNKLAFHLPHATILGGKNYRNTRHEDFERIHMFMDTKIHCDWADNLSSQFFNQIQSG